MIYLELFGKISQDNLCGPNDRMDESDAFNFRNNEKRDVVCRNIMRRREVKL